MIMKVLVSLVALFLSLIVGIGLSFFNQGMGVVASISIMGAFIVYAILEKK